MRLLVISLFLALCSCGDIEVRSTPGTTSVSSALAGEWQGTWSSGRTSTTGALTLRLQDFGGEPVVSFEIDNLCLAPAQYDLVLQGGLVSLVNDGVPVLVASLSAPEELSGSYGCAADDGVWTAQRTGALPELLDLSGEWGGVLAAPGLADEPIEVSLSQRVQAGQLVLDALVYLPNSLPAPVPMQGIVQFAEDTFEVQLASSIGAGPLLAVQGVGLRAPLSIPDATVAVVGPSPLPFTEATFSLEPR